MKNIIARWLNLPKGFEKLPTIKAIRLLSENYKNSMEQLFEAEERERKLKAELSEYRKGEAKTIKNMVAVFEESYTGRRKSERNKS
jgi:hypothetical protein